jgi:hypothetical protein
MRFGGAGSGTDWIVNNNYNNNTVTAVGSTSTYGIPVGTIIPSNINMQTNHDNTVGSNIRNILTTDFNNMLSQFQNISDHIKTPLNVGWQGSTANTWSNTTGRHNLTGDRLSDKIWIPSGHEVGDTTVTNNPGSLNNLWNLDITERSYSARGFQTWAWLRSAFPSGINGGPCVQTAGVFGTTGSQNTFAVRPALHITLEGLWGVNITATNTGIFSDCTVTHDGMRDKNLNFNADPTATTTLLFNAGNGLRFDTATANSLVINGQNIGTQIGAGWQTIPGIVKWRAFFTDTHGQYMTLELEDIDVNLTISATPARITEPPQPPDTRYPHGPRP